MPTDSKSGQPVLPKKPAEVIKFIKDYEVEFVDLRFLDFIGSWQHFTIPVDEVDKNFFENGLGFDGSSIRGWKAINASDMLLIPDPTTCKIDPVHGSRDPRDNMQHRGSHNQGALHEGPEEHSDGRPCPSCRAPRWPTWPTSDPSWSSSFWTT